MVTNTHLAPAPMAQLSFSVRSVFGGNHNLLVLIIFEAEK